MWSLSQAVATPAGTGGKYRARGPRFAGIFPGWKGISNGLIVLYRIVYAQNSKKGRADNLTVLQDFPVE